ncbi:CwfJ C-terminus 1-domain-containing protein-like protein [Collybia nuda]|uniref:CwfJ C-terminus 1-domain-containing protein-like protein n=1 Tax=Collybia nuda TaxID=64659 RepID=A0A9P5Y8I5_9AGAR|nr:CwfJ C-terminus 1-domain-containing protein-like protein [Collybia nuda]
MGDDTVTEGSTKHWERDVEKKSKKRRKHDDTGRKHKHRKKGSDSNLRIVDDDVNDDDMWVEKNIDMDGERVLATTIPTAESLKLVSSAVAGPSDAELPPNSITETTLKRDDWMLLPTTVPTLPTDARLKADDSMTDDYGEPSDGRRTLGGGVDFFSSLGTDTKRKPKLQRPDPDKPFVSSREINLNLGNDMDSEDFPTPPAKANVPGGPGSQWRMMRLRRVYEAVEEEGVDIEKIAIERFGSLAAFEEAKEERRILDEREGKRTERGRGSDRLSQNKSSGEKSMMFTDIGGSGASSRSSSFRRPGGMGDSAPSTPSPAPPDNRVPQNKRLDSLRLQSGTRSPLAQSHTPIPSVMTPPLRGGTRPRALSPSSLNRLQAKVLRAKLMGAPDAENLEREYEEEAKKANREEGLELGVRKKTEVLPTLDGRGRLYDVGHGKEDEGELPGNRKKKEKFETHDPKTGDIIRYNADDDTTTLGEMLRQEKFGAGMADQKDLDAQFARAIMGDGKFQNDLDYIDDNAEKLGRQKMRTDAMKRQFAIHDYKKTQKAMASCNFCFGDDDSPPKAPIIAMGTRVYLSCTVNEELVKGHCLIVPIQHHLNMLEGDDDVWDEVRNFMKCLMRMFAEEDQGVIFYETVISLKWQKHTCIECVPLPWEQYEVIPGYFKESILASEAEWSQHKKLLDFSARPGGFRRAMVPNLPYFMVQFDYKGEKGYGHVIEGVDSGGAEDPMEEGEKGGGEFPSYFAGEIVGNILELEVRRWRRPKRIDFRSNKERVAHFKKKFDKFDWTGMIGRG